MGAIKYSLNPSSFLEGTSRFRITSVTRSYTYKHCFAFATGNSKLSSLFFILFFSLPLFLSVSRRFFFDVPTCPLCSFTFFERSFRRTILGDFSWECLDFEIVAALSSPLVHATAACLACWQSFKRVSGTNYTGRLLGPSNNEFRTYNWMCRCRLHRAAFLTLSARLSAQEEGSVFLCNRVESQLRGSIYCRGNGNSA